QDSEPVGVESEIYHTIGEALLDLYAHFRDVLSPSFEELRENAYRPLLNRLGFEPEMLRAEVIEMAWLTDVEDQENRLDDFLEKHPDHALAHHVRGLVLANRGDYKRSLRSYERCITLDPDFPDGHNDLAFLLENFLGDRRRARQHYERAIELDRRFDLALNNLGVFLEREGDFEGAERLFEKALEVNPGYTGARMNRATLLAERFGRIEEARRELEQVLELDDNYAAAHANYAVLLEDFFDDSLSASKHRTKAQQLQAASGGRDHGWINRR
ncbi:MAG TPA: tetratricopeptide repeat protein, partial [Thermoanaerobaculia bacterium]|nr:tetratricopeptide repeat protein [Thermoanaerobaculia bacterium]